MLCAVNAAVSPMQPRASLLTPQMAELLQRIGRGRRQPWRQLTPQRARDAYELVAEVLDLPRAPLARVEALTFPGRGTVPPLQARLYAADQAPRTALLYLHGGGFVVGSPNTHDSLCRQLALRSGCAVVSLAYRLAPEHRFPAAVDDTWAALETLLDPPRDWRLRPGAVAVGGDSAGGTLAAVAALHARDRGWPLALQLLITPGTAARADTPSHARFGQGFLLDADDIAWFFDHTIAPEQRDDWRFAPLHADVEGTAPACVILAECDPLVDEGLAYADALYARGVPVQLELLHGVTHDFIKMGRTLKEANTALDAAAAALRAALNPP